jgi:hypothetical protein
VALVFHRELLAGLSVADALYRARQRAAIEAPGDATPWYFTLSGHPEFAWA